MMGRRDRGNKREAPGKGIGSGLGAGTGDSGPARPNAPIGRAPPGPGGSRPPRSPDAGAEGDLKDIDAAAPVPQRPSVYPAGSQYYVFPITFEIELLDRFAPKAPGQTAAGPAREGRS
jgi:hypothetical protein